MGQTIPISEVRSILTDHPGSAGILDHLVEFFGAGLAIERQPNSKNPSTWMVDLDLSVRPPKVRGAVLCVNTHSIAVVSALTHEMLHGKTDSLGFPIPYTADNLDARLADMGAANLYEEINNAVHHDIFLDEFLAVGLPRSEFVTPPSNAVELIRLTKNKKRLRPDVRLMKPLLYTAYIQLYTCGLHLKREELIVDVRTLARNGRRLLPSMDADTQRIREWFDRKAHKNPDTYGKAFNDLLSICGLPPASFYRLKRDSDGTVYSVAAQANK
jgi:hypothetical protein